MISNFPLFPLPLVTFPGARLPLQIFEPRYLDLVKTSLANDSVFGIVTLDDAQEATSSYQPEIKAVGTAVRIVDFNSQANGFLGVVCEGQYKFTVSSTHLSVNNLLLASIEEIPSEGLIQVPADLEELVPLLISLLQHSYVLSLGYTDFLEPTSWLSDAARLGYSLSYLLPFSTEQRYSLLAMKEPRERLESIQTALDLLAGASS